MCDGQREIVLASGIALARGHREGYTVRGKGRADYLYGQDFF